MTSLADATGIRRWSLGAQGVVHGLGFYALVMYGISYYAIGAAAPSMARDFGTTTSAIFAVLGTALIGSALAAPALGRLVDGIGAGPVLLWGGAARSVCLLGMASAPEIWSFVATLAVVQLLSQATEYDTIFAAAVQARGEEARASVSLVTLWGGLASTTFWPLTAFLLAHTSWRTMLVGYAFLLLVVSTAVALLVIREARRRERAATSASQAATPADGSPAHPAALGPPASHRDAPVGALPILVAAFSLASVAMALPVLLPLVLDGLGLGAGAVLAGFLFGPSQTAARLLEFIVGRRFTPLAVAVVATALLPISLAIILAGGASLASAVVFAVLFGAANGVGYVVRGTVVLQVFGAASYATWLGRIARIRLFVTAATPFVLAVLLERYGAAAALMSCLLCSALATGLFIHAWRRFR
jgi:hypothetical protein